MKQQDPMTTAVEMLMRTTSKIKLARSVYKYYNLLQLIKIITKDSNITAQQKVNLITDALEKMEE